jgi:hypothetical protein
MSSIGPTRTSRSQTKARGWWRDLFHDHPLLSQPAHPNHFSAFSLNNPKNRAKLYCKKCLAADVNALVMADEHAVQTGSRVTVRGTEELKAFRASLLHILTLNQSHRHA